MKKILSHGVYFYVNSVTVIRRYRVLLQTIRHYTLKTIRLYISKTTRLWSLLSFLAYRQEYLPWRSSCSHLESKC